MSEQETNPRILSNGLELPKNFDLYDEKTKELVIEYVSQLDSIQRHSYTIAKEHLGSSFNIARSNGFHEWKKENKK